MTEIFEVKNIPVEKLKIDFNNPRFNNKNIDSLVKSIKSEGLSEPLHVHYEESKDTYWIMAGGGRYVACMKLNYQVIPCVIHHDIENHDDCVKWISREVLLRRDYTNTEKLSLVRRLKNTYGSVRKGCSIEGYPYERIKAWMKLDNLTDSVIDSLTDIEIMGTQSPSQNALRSLSTVDKDKQKEAFDAIIGMSEREAIDFITEFKRPKFEQTGKLQDIRKSLELVDPNDLSLTEHRVRKTPYPRDMYTFIKKSIKHQGGPIGIPYVTKDYKVMDGWQITKISQELGLSEIYVMRALDDLDEETQYAIQILSDNNEPYGKLEAQIEHAKKLNVKVPKQFLKDLENRRRYIGKQNV